MPLAVPFHRRLGVGERDRGVVDFQGRSVATELGGVQFRERLVHFQNGVNGAFDHAGDIADDIGHGHEIFVIDAFVGGRFLDGHQLAQRNERRAGGCSAGLGKRVGVAGSHAQPE